MHSFFAVKAINSRTRAGLESVDDAKGVDDPSRVPQEPIAPKNPSVLKNEGVQDEDKPTKEFGQTSEFAEKEQNLDMIAEQQAAMEAIHDAIVRGNATAAALEEMADQLDAMVAPAEDGTIDQDAGLSEESAGVLQTALNASDAGDAGEVIAVESFAHSRRQATIMTAQKMRARAGAARKAVDSLQRKFDL